MAFGGDGGGFMSAVGNSQSPMGSSANAQRPEALIPVCVTQLKHAEKTTDYFRINGKEVDKIMLVGVIREVVATSMQIKYSIEDHTGVINAVLWLNSSEDDDGEDQKQKHLSEKREGQYVTLVGKLNEMEGGDRKLTAFSVEPIKDANQVTHHLLAIVQAYCVHKFGVKHTHNLGSMPGQAASTNMAAGTAVAATSVSAGDYQAQPSAAAMSTGSNMPPAQQKVYYEIQKCHDEKGISVDELKARLGPQGVSAVDVAKAIEALGDEGSIYSTVDDDHYRTTE